VIPDFIKKAVENFKEIGQYRELKIYDKGIDFFSNDYLGLAKKLVFNVSDVNLGATGSRLISGNSVIHEELEEFLSNWYQKSSLLFGSGYLANVGVLSSIASRHDTILYDSLCHASIKDGIRLSLAKSFPFPHNNYEKLEKLIQNSKGNVFVVVESVYSMDGDSPNPMVLRDLVKKYGIYLIVDEAHSFGICGNEGRGWVYENQLMEDTFLGIFPLGKAAGAYGAFVIAEPLVIDYLINSARTFIYSTALPQFLVKGIYENIQFIAKANAEREHLKILAEHFQGQWIYPFIIPGNDNCKNMANLLQKKGFLVKAILSPTVPKGKERIRMVLHSYNSLEEVLDLKNCCDLDN